jgi:hypothetical protein
VKEYAQSLARSEPATADGVAGVWQDFSEAAHFFQFLVREYLPLARLSGAERVTREAWRERLWLRPHDVERMYTEVSFEVAMSRTLADGRIVVRIPMLTDRRVGLGPAGPRPSNPSRRSGRTGFAEQGG